MALIAVAVVGLSKSASAAVDGKIYVTNVASGLTDQPGNPGSRTTVSTVYGTYPSVATSGAGAREVVADSDLFIVTVVDADENHTTAEASENHDISGLAAAGQQLQLTLNNTDPIIGGLSTLDVVANAAGNADVPNVTVKSIDFAGDGTNPPIITIGLDYLISDGLGGTLAVVSPVNVNYSSSLEDTVTVNLKSVVDSGWNGDATTGSADALGYDLVLTETDRNTGVFEGYVRVFERNDATVPGTHGTDSTSSASGGAATVAVIGGPVNVTYTDVHASNAKRIANIHLDTTPPIATISSPSTGSETQNRLPNFTGNVSDAESGLDVSTFGLYIDQTADATNQTIVITNSNTTVAPTINGTIASIDTSGTSDGASTMSFSHTPSAAIPTAVGSNPDHVVDYQVRVADLAGNYGYSDSDSSVGNDGTGRHGAQPHTIKIDQVIPQISSADSGVGLDTSVSPTVDKANVRDTIKVTFDGKIKDTSVSASDFQVVFSGAGGTFVPASVTVKNAVVYLDLDTTIPSDNKPTVKIQGTIQDLAGNSTDAGSAVANDKLAPVVTVTQSGGSAAGDPDGLTNDKMTVSVASDEDLQGPPAITVTDLTPDPDVTVTGFNSTLAVAQGGNTWSLVVTKSSSASGDRAVKVVATDSAGNSATVGKDTTKTYVLDLAVAAATSSPATSTTQSNPFLTTDFSSDQSTLSVTEATLDGVDVTSQVIASANSKKFFFQPTTALTNKEHTYVVKVADAAGNTATVTNTFTKSDRTDFVLELFAGWNAVSLPSNPLDTDVNTVLSNTGVKQVVAYDATTPSQPWRIASKVGSGAYTSQTTPGLSTVSAGPGYWVETSDFEDQKISLEGPTGPGDARPGLTTIATGNGWNLVGVVDQSRTQTQAANKGTSLTRPDAGGTNNAVKSSAYFNTVNNGRAYTFDTVDSEFRELVDTDNVTIGSGIWVFISPQDNGQLPHIVP
jgi:hypothetical protein